MRGVGVVPVHGRRWQPSADMVGSLARNWIDGRGGGGGGGGGGNTTCVYRQAPSHDDESFLRVRACAASTRPLINGARSRTSPRCRRLPTCLSARAQRRHCASFRSAIAGGFLQGPPRQLDRFRNQIRVDYETRHRAHGRHHLQPRRLKWALDRRPYVFLVAPCRFARRSAWRSRPIDVRFGLSIL